MKIRPYSLRVVALLVVSLATLPVACATSNSNVHTFVEPSIAPGSISGVAILPMRNSRLLPDESRELNRDFTRTFQAQNPGVNIIGPAEAVAALNAAGLTDRYSEFLRNYATSGIPDANTLKAIGAALKVDGIVQGEVFDITQRDGEYGSNRGETSVTVRYALMGTATGSVLWESKASGKKGTKTTIGKAPPLFEAISLAQEKILAALPKLGR